MGTHTYMHFIKKEITNCMICTIFNPVSFVMTARVIHISVFSLLTYECVCIDVNIQIKIGIKQWYTSSLFHLHDDLDMFPEDDYVEKFYLSFSDITHTFIIINSVYDCEMLVKICRSARFLWWCCIHCVGWLICKAFIVISGGVVVIYFR